MNFEQKQTVECTLYFSAFDTGSLMLTTLERYIADVRSGKHKKTVEKVRSYLAASENEKAEAVKKGTSPVGFRRSDGWRPTARTYGSLHGLYRY